MSASLESIVLEYIGAYGPVTRRALVNYAMEQFNNPNPVPLVDLVYCMVGDLVNERRLQVYDSEASEKSYIIRTHI